MTASRGAIAHIEVWITYDGPVDLDELDRYLSTVGARAIERRVAECLPGDVAMVRAEVRSVHARERETDGQTASAVHWTMGGAS